MGLRHLCWRYPIQKSFVWGLLPVEEKDLSGRDPCVTRRAGTKWRSRLRLDARDAAGQSGTGSKRTKRRKKTTTTTRERQGDEQERRNNNGVWKVGEGAEEGACVEYIDLALNSELQYTFRHNAGAGCSDRRCKESE
jgi:hypothetical protein